MDGMYAVALSISESTMGPSASASLHFKDDREKVVITMGWAELPATVCEESPGAWMVAVLSALIENFDDHEVTEASSQRGEVEGQAARG